MQADAAWTLTTKHAPCAPQEAREAPALGAVALHVQTSNEEAIRFYEKQGFRRLGVVENYYKRLDPPHAQLLRLDLR